MNKISVVWFNQPVQINTGEVLDEAPSKIDFVEKHYEVLMPIGKDHTMSFYVSESAILEHPELFTAIDDNDNVINE